MFDIVLGRIRFVGSRWPMTFHHFIGDPAVERGIYKPGSAPYMVKYFLIDLDPIHFSIWAGYKTIKGNVHK
jgi:hypothetical protein